MRPRFPGPFLVEERFPITSKLLRPYSQGLHRSKDRDTLSTDLFFYLKTPPSFSIIFSISSLTCRENLASEGSMQSRLFSHPAPPTPLSSALVLHIALGYKRDVPPFLIPPPSYGQVPPFPTYNSIFSPHNLSISRACPLGLRGLAMEPGFVSQLTALLLCSQADQPYTGILNKKHSLFVQTTMSYESSLENNWYKG